MNLLRIFFYNFAEKDQVKFFENILQNVKKMGCKFFIIFLYWTQFPFILTKFFILYFQNFLDIIETNRIGKRCCSMILNIFFDTLLFHALTTIIKVLFCLISKLHEFLYVFFQTFPKHLFLFKNKSRDSYVSSFFKLGNLTETQNTNMKTHIYSYRRC